MRTNNSAFVGYARYQKGNPSYGQPSACYGCGTPHNASGIAVIRDEFGTFPLPLCDSCFEAERTDGNLVRNVWPEPVLLTDKLAQDSTEH